MNDERMTNHKVNIIKSEKSVRQWSGQRLGRVIFPFPPHPTYWLNCATSPFSDLRQTRKKNIDGIWGLAQNSLLGSQLYITSEQPIREAFEYQFCSFNISQTGEGGGHSGLNQRVSPSYYNFQVSPRTLCTISTDCFAETSVTVSFNHILCTFWSINMRMFTHQMTNH